MFYLFKEIYIIIVGKILFSIYEEFFIVMRNFFFLWWIFYFYEKFFFLWGIFYFYEEFFIFIRNFLFLCEKNIQNLETKDNNEPKTFNLQELDVLVQAPVSLNYKGPNSLETLTATLVQLINASWSLVQRHRMIERIHEKHNDVYHKVSIDNNNLGVSNIFHVFICEERKIINSRFLLLPYGNFSGK